MRSVDLSGQVFGKWTVVCRTNKPKPSNRNGVYWLCKCICGKEKAVLGHTLVKGMSNSCGCSRKGPCSKNWRGCGDVSGAFLRAIECRARWRNLECNLTTEYLWNLFLEQDRKCALSGIALIIKPSMRNYARTMGNASVDRIDSNIGYIPGNIQWLHKMVNQMKHKYNQEEFIRMCQIITDHATISNSNRSLESI